MSMERLNLETVRKSKKRKQDIFVSQAEGLSLTSYLLPGSPAPYDEKQKGHVRNLTIQKDSNYTIQPYTITEGPMKGCQALILVPIGGFRFLDLPTEIRYMIYELLLAGKSSTLRPHTPGREAGPYDVKADRLTYKYPPKKVVGDDYAPTLRAWQKKREWNVRLEKWIDPKCTPMSLLLVNKQVYGEAFEVLYRSHEFQFQCAEALFRFFKLNKASAKYITHVGLTVPDNSWEPNVSKSLQKRSAQRALKILNKAQPAALRKLEFWHHELHNLHKPVAETLVAACMPVLNTVYRARQRDGVTKGIDEVLKIRHGKSLCRVDQGCKTLDSDIKKLVRERFLMDE